MTKKNSQFHTFIVDQTIDPLIDPSELIKQIYKDVHSFCEALPKKSKNIVILKVPNFLYSVVEDLLKEINVPFRYAELEDIDLSLNLRPSVRASLVNQTTASFAKFATPVELDIFDADIKLKIESLIEEALLKNKNLTSAILNVPVPLLSLTESLLNKRGIGVYYVNEASTKKPFKGLGAYSAKITKGINTIRNALPNQGKGVSFFDIFENTPIADVVHAASLTKEEAQKTFGGYSLTPTSINKLGSYPNIKMFFNKQRSQFPKDTLQQEISDKMLEVINNEVPEDLILKVHKHLLDKSLKANVKKPTLFDALAVYSRAADSSISAKEIILSHNKILTTMDKVRGFINA